MKILMVVMPHDQLGSTGRKTGLWHEEFAAPYFVFRDAGVELTRTSPEGGQAPIDPTSDLPEDQTPAMTQFKQDDHCGQHHVPALLHRSQERSQGWQRSGCGLAKLFREAVE
jgi:hypothetical protein